MDMELISRLWEPITRKETGLLALVIVVFGLAKNWWEIKKLRQENVTLNLEISASQQKLPLEIVKLSVEIAKLSLETERTSRELTISRENRPEVIECLNTITENVNQLWNGLSESFRPILLGKIRQSDREKRLADIAAFAEKQEYRPNIERALSRLRGLTKSHNVPVITKLLAEVQAFCEAVSKKQCFLSDISEQLRVHGQLSSDLSQAILHWQNEVKDRRGKVTVVAGWVQGLVESKGLEEIAFQEEVEVVPMTPNNVLQPEAGELRSQSK